MELAATWASLLFIPYLSPLLLPEDGDIHTVSVFPCLFGCAYIVCLPDKNSLLLGTGT